MADNKKSIVVYADWINKFEELEDDEAGRLIKHFFRYVNDLNPEAPDRTTKLMFMDIQATLKRDLSKWEKTLEGRSAAGKASAEARRIAKELQQNPTNSTNSTNVTFVEKNPTNSTDSVSVNVSDNVNDILLKKETKYNYKAELLNLVKNETLVDDYIALRRLKKAPQTKTQLDGLIKECNDNKFSVSDAIKICIENNWQGFKFNWIKENKEKNKTYVDSPA